MTTFKLVCSHYLGINTTANSLPEESIILFDIRIPRVLLAVLVGFALATAGVVYQTLLRNPLADPFVIGVSSGSALGAMVAMALRINQTLWGAWGIPLFAFIGGTSTVFIILLLARNHGHFQSQSLLLAGVIVNAFFSAMIMFISTVIDPGKIQTYMFWMIGHLETVSPSMLKACYVYVIIGWIILWINSRALNALSFGEETAKQLGIPIDHIKILIFIVASLVAGAVVSVSGIIGFVGLIVPHIVRSMVGSDHRILLPCSALGGALFLVVADTIARVIISPAELPVGVITALCGAPFFIYLLRSRYWKHF